MNNEEKQTHLQELIRRKSYDRAMTDYDEFKKLIFKNKFACRLRCKEEGQPFERALYNNWFDILEPLTIRQTIKELTEKYIIEETEEIFKKIEFARSKNKEIINE